MRGVLALALALLAAAWERPAAADELLSPDELLARSHAATGFDRKAESEREVWSVRSAGLDGTLETLRHGADFASVTTVGPFRTAHGLWHGQRWQQDENGQTIVDRPEPSQSDRIWGQNVERVHDPLDAWQLTTTYASGHTARSFYDPRTYRLVRTERSAAGLATHIAYDDFRTDARGRTRAWHYAGGDARPDNGFEYRLERDEIEADVSDDDVAIPHERRTLVEFPAGVDTVRLPARIAESRIYIRLQIAGRGLDFLLDTGSSLLTIDQALARDLGLAVRGRTTETIAGSFESGRVTVPTVEIGPLAMHDVVFHTVPLASYEGRGTRVVGLLGYDFLASVGLKIDYANGTLDAMRPGSLATPPEATVLDVRLNSGTPVARATIGGASGEDFIIDTGAAFSYVVFQRFARAHPEATSPSGDGRIRTGAGVGGSMAFRPIASKRVGLGTWTFDDALGVEATAPNALGFDTQDGLIGGDILKLFTVYLDYGESRLFLAPNARMAGIEAANTAQER